MATIKEILDLAKKRSEELERRKDLNAKVDVLSRKIKLDPERRSENLRLLRAYMNAHQDSFVGMLGIGSQSMYSKIERGESTLSEAEARSIEEELSLPLGWLDRNNGDSIFLTNEELLLIKSLKGVSASAILATQEAIEKLRLGNG
jgi:transcriptional regulator with XRE-family HTH domain